MKNKRNFLRNGWIQLRYNRRKQIILALISIAFIVCWTRVESISGSISYPTIPDGANGIFDSIIKFFETMLQTFFPDFSLSSVSISNHIFGYIVLILIYVFLVVVLMYNPKANIYSENFRRAGISNGKKETPIFLHFPKRNLWCDELRHK